MERLAQGKRSDTLGAQGDVKSVEQLNSNPKKPAMWIKHIVFVRGGESDDEQMAMG